MSKISVVFITVDKKTNAKKIISELLKNRLAACVNLVENIESTYRWKGKIEKSGEFLLIIKTAKSKVKKLINHVKKIHPYTVPEIIAFDINKGNKDYIDWVIKETGNTIL